MIVTAALCWYAETPATLERSVLSLEHYCDRIVAFNGRWVGFPEIDADDAFEQMGAVQQAAESIGIEHNVIGSHTPWPTQVEKRNKLMQTASRGADWVFVIDADEFVEKGDPDAFRQTLADTSLDVAMVYFHRIPTIPYGRNVRRIYRTKGGVITVERAHNGYVSHDGQFLHGDHAWVDIAEAEEATAGQLTIAHDLLCRNQSRKNARTAYLKHRRKNRIEVWV